MESLLHGESGATGPLVPVPLAPGNGVKGKISYSCEDLVQIEQQSMHLVPERLAARLKDIHQTGELKDVFGVNFQNNKIANRKICLQSAPRYNENRWMSHLVQTRMSPEGLQVVEGIPLLLLQIKSILNKVTEQNYEKIKRCVQDLLSSRADDWQAEIAGLVINKALKEPFYRDIYANLCRHMAHNINGREDNIFYKTLATQMHSLAQNGGPAAGLLPVGYIQFFAALLKVGMLGTGAMLSRCEMVALKRTDYLDLSEPRLLQLCQLFQALAVGCSVTCLKRCTKEHVFWWYFHMLRETFESGVGSQHVRVLMEDTIRMVETNLMPENNFKADGAVCEIQSRLISEAWAGLLRLSRYVAGDKTRENWKVIRDMEERLTYILLNSDAVDNPARLAAVFAPLIIMNDYPLSSFLFVVTEALGVIGRIKYTEALQKYRGSGNMTKIFDEITTKDPLAWLSTGKTA